MVKRAAQPAKTPEDAIKEAIDRAKATALSASQSVQSQQESQPPTQPGYSIDPTTGQRTVSTQYGNIQYQPLSTERPQELEDLLTRFRTISEQGYSAPEYAARRAQAANVVKAQQQAQQRDLLTQQARQGVRGGAAVAQQTRAAQQQAAQRAALEQNIMLEDIKNKQAMMGQYGGLLGGAISREDRLAMENLKRDIGAQVVGVGAGITGAQLNLADLERLQGEKLFQDYLDYLREQGAREDQPSGVSFQVGGPSVPISGIPSNINTGGGFSTSPFGGSGTTYGGGY